MTRFPTRAHFASWNGTAPIDASSGDQVRHRLSRAGNRQINRVLHIMAVVQLRNQTEGRAYFDRKVAAGKTPMEAMRALKRRLSDIVYHQMITDARAAGTGPGGHLGAATGSSAAGLTPAPALRRSHFPDPPLTTLRQQSQPILLVAPGALRQRRTAAVVKRTLLDDGEDRSTLSRPGMTPLDTEGSHVSERSAVLARQRGSQITLLGAARTAAARQAKIAARNVACHEHGTALRVFLPRAWDHLVASDGTTRRVAPGVLITSGIGPAGAPRLRERGQAGRRAYHLYDRRAGRGRRHSGGRLDRHAAQRCHDTGTEPLPGHRRPAPVDAARADRRPARVRWPRPATWTSPGWERRWMPARHDLGALVAPPGSGKTVIACAGHRRPPGLDANPRQPQGAGRPVAGADRRVLGVKAGQLGGGRAKLSPATGQVRLIAYGISGVSKSRTMRPRMPPAAAGGVPRRRTWRA